MKSNDLNGSFRLRFRKVFGAALSLAFLSVIFFTTSTSAQAQSATIFGSLSNFDVVNNVGQDAHGFEIQLEGLQQADVLYAFSVQRYGAPAIVPYATGIYVRWTSGFDPNAQSFVQTTIAHPPGTPFAGSCYQWGTN